MEKPEMEIPEVEIPEVEIPEVDTPAKEAPVNKTPAIKVSGLTKEFRYYKSNHQRIQHEMFGRDTGERIPVLNNISFEIARGEKVALLGGLGSGRTTLMRILAGIIKADSGTLSVNGDITMVFDHKLGFERILTGRDNYRLRCALLGWPKEIVEEHEEAIFKAADLIDYIDTPFRGYKTGAPTRLGFMIATEFAPDIMLYDEGFSFGGASYTNTCLRRLKRCIKGKNTTLFMTATNLPVAKKLCTRCLVLDEGDIKFDGPFEEALQFYRENCKQDPEKEKAAKARIAAAEDTVEEDDDDIF